ncbi:hypothetical protein [Micromonospora sp. DT233]|uniref:hypothetical protein n=1 Tax=Micromonospora sp. DT233 TaxID=3393432 RepID=UPI003CF8EB13
MCEGPGWTGPGVSPADHAGGGPGWAPGLFVFRELPALLAALERATRQTGRPAPAWPR